MANEKTRKPSADTSMLNASVAVAVSTYNGEKYIREQIESLLAQTLPNMRIFVRDDGSSDGTVRILEEYAAMGLIELTVGGNVGVTQSFFDCVQSIPEAYDYIALCDQDDRWHPGKLERAVSVLAERRLQGPVLYCSELLFCDESLHAPVKSHLNRKGVDFQHMLFETVCFGNTMVFNRELAQAAIQPGMEDVVSHDWWLALVASALGELVFDDAACIDYRRTGSNVSAAGKSAVQMLSFRIKNFIVGDGMNEIKRQNRRLMDLYGPVMQKRKREQLCLFCSGSRLSMAFAPFGLRQKLIDDIALRLLLLVGR